MEVLLFISLAVIVFLTVIAFLVFPAVRRHPDRKKLLGMHIAHRGLHDSKKGIPENSLAAFGKAVECGFAIENDIHITADGEVVVFHDSTLKRMCGVNGKVEEMTLSELKKCRLLETDERIPTLKECLEKVNGKVPLLIEFKCDETTYEELCEKADVILSKYNGEYFVQSFYPPVLGWYRKKRKNICRGQLASAFKGDKLHKRMLGCMLFNFIARPDFVSYDHKYSGNIMRRIVTKLGAFPVCWTLRTKEEYTKSKKYFKAYIFESFTPDK